MNNKLGKVDLRLNNEGFFTDISETQHDNIP